MSQPTPDERTADDEQTDRRRAERVAPLRRAYRDLPPTDDRFAALLDQLRGVMPQERP